MSTPDFNDNPAPPPDDERERRRGAGRQPGFAELAETVAAESGFKRDEQGRIDVLSAVGGWRGMCETVLPGLAFLVSFIVSTNLGLSLILAVAIAVIFAAVRLVQRGSVMSAVYGLLGIVVCALVARTTGNALDYYVPGFFIDVVSIIVILVSVLARWPITGVIFGFLRGEGVQWRKEARRRRSYNAAAWIVLALFAARLLVQVPLYFAADLGALGIARLVMGVPLYALVLWLSWMVSRPEKPSTTAA